MTFFRGSKLRTERQTVITGSEFEEALYRASRIEDKFLRLRASAVLCLLRLTGKRRTEITMLPVGNLKARADIESLGPYVKTQWRAYIDHRDALKSHIMGFTVDAILIDPYGEIDRAMKNEDWVSGFSHAITYTEHFGIIKIKNYIESSVLRKIENEENKNAVNNQFKDDLKNIGAKNIVLLLFALEIIDSDTYLKLREIITERNKLQHPTRKEIGYRYIKKEKTKRECLLEEAKAIISEIQWIRL